MRSVVGQNDALTIVSLKRTPWTTWLSAGGCALDGLTLRPRRPKGSAKACEEVLDGGKVVDEVARGQEQQHSQELLHGVGRTVKVPHRRYRAEAHSHVEPERRSPGRRKQQAARRSWPSTAGRRPSRIMVLARAASEVLGHVVSRRVIGSHGRIMR